jgi:propanol-preferring alcohol dehydrogenase
VAGPGQILGKIAATGVCHTDLHAAEGDWPVKPKPPFIPGHEGVGHVAAVGPGVSHVKEGDRVGVPWLYTACGHCRHCLGGWETLCEKQQNTGYSVNGGFAEYVVADPDYVGHLPDKVSFVEIAPILCAGVTVYKGLKATDTRPGDWVVVSGIGGLGHMAVQYARAMGLNVVAVDVDDAKLDLARRCGATDVVNAQTEDAVGAVQGIAPGGVDFAFEAIGRPATIQQALAMTGFGATLTVVGIADPADQFSFTGLDLMMGKVIRQSLMGSNRFAADIPALVEHALAGRLDLDIMVSEERGLDDVGTVLDRLEAGDVLGRAVITF